MSKTTIANLDQDLFAQTIAAHKKRVDTALECYVSELQAVTAEQFGEYPLEAVNTFTDVLSRGGKRIRGSLAIVAYQMFGGKDAAMIDKAACALEMLNTYILIADDIQDRSPTRRGGKTAHVMMRDYHELHHLKGDAQHFGEAIAINSFLIAQHYAMNIFASLNVSADIRIKAIQNINKCFIATAHGQTLDIFNEVIETVDELDINNVLIWKTAYYTFINPLQLGAILAGASDTELKELADYGLHAGRLFQLTDDMLGTFGKESDSGKSPLDDIQEGKRTLLVLYALKHAPKSDAYFLEQCLGNQNLTMAEFDHCKKIIKDSGAVAYAQQEALQSEQSAAQVIDANPQWDQSSSQFLRQLTSYLLTRKA